MEYIYTKYTHEQYHAVSSISTHTHIHIYFIYKAMIMSNDDE